jgi:copper(I)-binding protein
VSRAEHNTTTRRRVLGSLVPSVLGLGLAAVLTGCGAGQITQTDTQIASINGANGDAGSMSVRNVTLAFPDNTQGVFAPGSSAALVVTIVNNGLTDDTLTGVSSPAVTQVTIDGAVSGGKKIPGGFSVTSFGQTGSSSASSAAPTTTAQPPSSAPPVSQPPSSGAPSSPAVPPGVPNGSGNVSPAQGTPTNAAPELPGTVKIELIGFKSVNGAPFRAGLTIPVTFTFAHAGQVTLAQVPVGAPPASQG